MTIPARTSLTWAELAEEPFRFFFPLGLAAGLIGVALWPLHFAGVVEFYPGASHARLMAHGFFGAFILGFLGTALPRLLSVPRLTFIEAGLAGVWHACTVSAHAMDWVRWGDRFFALLLATIALSLGCRFYRRGDVPPPGFVLVPLAFLCGWIGVVIAELERHNELPFFWVTMRPLFFYQGFVLLPILGVGGFILPRFFGLASAQAYPESRTPPAGWTLKASVAGIVGLAVMGSFVLEAMGWPRTGVGMRLVIVSSWLWREVPIHRAACKLNTLAWGIRVALVLLGMGFLSEVLFPAYRVAMLHLVLMGGFGVITLSVATRVAFGHSGQSERFEAPNRWLKATVWLMLIGMATRISGDLWPAIMKSHYIYGALLWTAGLFVWAWNILPQLAKPEPRLPGRQTDPRGRGLG